MRKLQTNTLARCLMVLCALLLAGGSVPIHADVPGNHAAYLRAIRDLREARALLEDGHFTEPKHVQAVSTARPEIDKAIMNLKNACKADDKALGDVPHDKSMPNDGRFHKVYSLLNSAMEDTHFEESDPAAHKFRDEALYHINAARGDVQKAL